MIKINISNKDGQIHKINMIGHADYDDYGKDIVCAGASSIVTTTVNAILTFDKKFISYEEKKDNFEIVINTHNEIVDNLITNMLNMLQELENDYPTWLAHYTNRTDYKGNYKCWQRTSLAKIPGITVNTVDFDICYK